ncbi:MAG: hypothetical protein AAB275_06915 [Deltaproteobacteria bacterium]
MSSVSAGGKAYVRRTYYIKKDFQKRFIYEYMVMVLLGIVLANGVLYLLLNRGVDNAFYKAHMGITSTGDIVWSPLLLTGMAIITAATLNVIIFALINTWKVGSCMHCLNSAIEKLKDGDMTTQLPPCQKNSLMLEACTIFDKTARHLNKRIYPIKVAIEELDSVAAGIEKDRATSIEQILKKVESTEGHLSAFKLRQ